MKKLHFVKTVLTVAGVLALGTFSPKAFAQEQSAPPAATQQAGMHRHGGGPFADLNLTADQKAQIKKIHMDARAKADAVKADTSLSDADKQTKMKEIHKTARMESEKVLTPEQRAQLKEKMKERRAEKAANPS